MTIRFVAIGLVLALAGCSSDSDRTADRAALGSAAVAPTPPLAGTTTALHAHTFATLPDKGDLVAYSASAPRKVGPSTWHRAEVSEAHALRAIASGRLRMTTPDGQVLDYRFQRHVEHANGNWTWIGKLPAFPGREAIITFGERAAFGSFGRPGAEPLRLTIRDGVAWIVEVDPRALRGVDAHAGQRDYLVAPKLVEQAAMSKQAATAVPAMAAGGPVVDVAVGYTSGLATLLGGQSQAVTRVTHLVALTNEAYAASNLNAQVRLVRTVQVNYPDNTSNDTALSELSGTDGDSSVPIPASLVPLRQARDTYGADLVSLVRKFNDPEHAGCGLAWLLGGDQTPIDSGSAPYGYSAVSDGDDGGFFCREETFAHELGHNMGQAHNVEDSNGSSGAHAYAYGYREASATGFYTIMAYRSGDSQFSIPRFANPSVTYSGRPTGVANTADNVRSMALTMPLIATFRATAVPLGAPDHDFDGDAKSDILWRNTSDGRNTIWKAASSANTLAVASVADQNWKIAGVGDFDGDGKSDILWRHAGTGWNSLWKSGSSTTSQTLTTLADQNWKVAGIGDFDGNGKSDILWRHATSGQNVLWKGALSAASQTLTTVADQNWKVVGVGDFDADGKSDIVWRHSSMGWNSLWKSGSSATSQTLTTVADTNWKIVGVGDFNDDGRSDLLWRHSGNGANSLWRSGSSATSQALTQVTDQNWKVAGVADYDGNGSSDILWRHAVSGANVLWKSASSSSSTNLASAAISWIVAP